MWTQIKETLQSIWRDKWEAIAGISGLIGSLGTTEMPPWLMGLSGGLLLLLSLDLAWHSWKCFWLAREKHVPLVVAAGVSDDQFDGMMNQVWELMGNYWVDETQLELWGVKGRKLALHYEPPLPLDRAADWARLAGAFARRVHHVDSSLTSPQIFHLFLRCPTALAVGLGAAVGTHHQMTLYHYQTNIYSPLMVLDASHVVRQTVITTYQFIEVEPVPSPLTAEVVVSVWLSGNDPKNDAITFATSLGLSAVHFRKKYADNLPTQDSWLEVAQEVFAELAKLRTQGVQRLHLCLNMPVMIAFAVGTALGRQSPVTVYHWDAPSHKYYIVSQLEQLTV